MDRISRRIQRGQVGERMRIDSGTVGPLENGFHYPVRRDSWNERTDYQTPYCPCHAVTEIPRRQRRHHPFALHEQ